MTADAYDVPLSAIRNRVDDLGAWLAIWSARDDGKPDAHARRFASDAVDAIDAALRALHQARQQLTGEIRASDDASAARADELLGRRDPPVLEDADTPKTDRFPDPM